MSEVFKTSEVLEAAQEPPAAPAPATEKLALGEYDVYVTDDPAEYARMVAEGLIVFDRKELALIAQSGATSAEALLIVDWPDQAARIRAFRPNWHRMITGDIPQTVALFEGLIDAGRDVTMLTNFAADTFVEARARFGFLNRTRGVTVSGEVGLIKPDPAIYGLHQQSFDLEPGATLFIDDNEANVAAAQAFGWQAVQYTGHDRLVADLAQRGVIPA